MTASAIRPIEHAGEPVSNADRAAAAKVEPRSLRTFTPTQAVLAKSAGVYHWTADNRRLYDFTSGVLVSNLGHNPTSWMKRFCEYMGWTEQVVGLFGGSVVQANGKAHSSTTQPPNHPTTYFQALGLTTYNAVTPIEAEAGKRLIEVLRKSKGGARMEQLLWAASGSEAVQKALWAALARDKTRPMILATRNGFHGKKGLSCAVTGSETDTERDPRVRFISFPTTECKDLSLREQPFDPAPYRKELDALWNSFGRKIGTLITEPYLGGGGSYHPHKAYLQMLEKWCRENDVVFILDEVQANFGRTGDMFAFETYGIEPDLVVLGKGLGNGVPVAATVGRKDILTSLEYGEASDTWSANPLSCAAVLATLDEFAASDVLANCRASSAIIEAGLVKLKRFPFVAAVRGEKGGMVWGVEFQDHAGKTGPEWANAFVLSCYRGEGSDGIHLLGPLSRKVVRVAPPLVITKDEATAAMAILDKATAKLLGEPVAV